MKPSFFRNLSLSNKSTFLWAEGEHLFTRIENGSLIKLYLLYGFFVEVYHKSPNLQIDKITVVDNLANLECYLDSIELPKL